MKKTLIAAAIVAAGLSPVAVMAQAAPAAAAAPTVGAKVYDPAGAEVGTVEAVAGGVVTVNTGLARAGLPTSAFAMRDKGPTIGMTKAELEAAVNGAKAQQGEAKDAALVDGAAIKSNDGKVLGTIGKVEGDDVTMMLTDGNGASAMFKKANIGLMPDGTLAIGMTADAFYKAVGVTPPAPGATPADGATPPAPEAPAATN
ncbi:hypothetical protein MTR62_10165 [Novosphingobium sp. 1949]|uniref:PRC-barrel domain-containing protein n=1 Tax=Novosphingobium organovorum TaxID=2930092 RepID=A0ABT0BDB2_9SPHN|nr:hypothetical protein [Novosphingobium organovorum]MCJ2183052.1 hypothetical protein [Novosphingobium organovorum]